MSKLKPYSEHMTSCPKCGGDVAGPKYDAGRHQARYLGRGKFLHAHVECMHWTCAKCGYDEVTACLDYKDE